MIRGVSAKDPGHTANSSIIPPLKLFGSARSPEERLELDRRCRDTIFSSSSSFIWDGHIPLLFVNIDLGNVREVPGAFRFLQQQVANAGLSPEQIAIEIVESRVSNADILTDFVSTYRDAGFLIVLDDFGADHSNLDRILLVRPDIVKIDRNLISGLDTDHYRQAVFQAIVSLAHRIGSLVLAEGVETEAESRMCSLLGAELQQGYSFARPGSDPKKISVELQGLLEDRSRELCSCQRELQNQQQLASEEYRETGLGVINQLRKYSIEDIDLVAEEVVGAYPRLECLYCLNPEGKQISSTLHGSSALARHPAFHPAVKGTDHSLKPYFLQLRYADFTVTEPYISFASGKNCRTVSMRWSDCNQNEVILCLDFSQ
ncbi:EAL domain-containing protein [Spirochaeta dissipatitropha]